MKNQEMTEKQKTLYSAIKDFIETNGYSPTIRELNLITNIKSASTTFTKLRVLKRKGYITFIENKSRTIRIIK